MPFNEAKAVQAAAWMVSKAGGSMSKLKLVKLIYLAERAFVAKYGLHITGDRFVSMPHGPVPSQTLDLINGFTRRTGSWSSWMNDLANNTVSLRSGRSVERAALEDLSDAEIEALEGTFAQFGSMSPSEVVEYTHRHCPEWSDPKGSSFGISTIEMLEAQGVNRTSARAISDSIREDDALRRLLASV